MSKLTLEQAKKIGHLFPNAKYPGDACECNGRPYEEGDRNCKYCGGVLPGHEYGSPELEEMLDWIFMKADRFDRWAAAAWDMKFNHSDERSFRIKAKSWTEAAYKAICIIEGIES